jgi:sugar-phosphatase
MLLCDAIIFDLDGVLIDSTACLERHLRAWATRQGLDPSVVLDAAHGRRTAETIQLVAPHLDKHAEAAAIEEAEACDTVGVVDIPGAHDLLAALPPAAWAIATSNARRTALLRLQHTGLLTPRVMITSESVRRGKPDPEVYLLAAEQLGVDPRRCVAVEDAPAGLSAARAAGMTAIGVLGTHVAAQLSEAQIVIARLANLRVERLPSHAEARLAVIGEEWHIQL